ncbi:MAG: sulfatase [Hyphomicrobiaceae bacterium]|nr:sulfatase [Hyphomicrobiaceae bacterium]
MADQSAGRLAQPSRTTFGLRQLQPATACAASAAVALAVLALRWGTEGGPATSVFAIATCLALAASVVLLTRRLLFGTVLVAGLALSIVLGSAIKLKKMNMVMHAYDLLFYLSSWSTVTYLWYDYRRYFVTILAALLGALLASAIAFQLDGSRVPRRHAALAVVLFATAAYGAAIAKGERRHTEFAYAGQYLTYFFSSWPETIETLWRGQLLEAALRAPGPPLRVPAHCGMAAKPPHIVLIHQESVVPPGYFPGLEYDRSLDSHFESDDGKLHKLRVETYGGASWLTEFSLLAGISTYSLGGMRSFVQLLMAGKVHDTLPQTLARCGYRNVVLYPMLRNFVSNDRFYASIGLPEIFDLRDQGATTVNERDSFYYGNALDEMERHIARSEKPLFTYIQTMSTHWPYDTTYLPAETVPGGGPGTHPEMHEYLRRLALAKRDYDVLKAEIARRFPGEPILIVRYGDHHPVSTRMLLGFDESLEAEDVELEKDSVGFLTYYTIEGVNYRPPELPVPDTVDIPYLGTILLEAARLPLSEAYRERKRLLSLCEGRYYTCPERGEILRFHRRLIDSGLVEAR